MPLFSEASNNKPNSTSIRIFHSNVLSTNTNYLDLIKQINKEIPDVVLLQEVNSAWISNLSKITSSYIHTIEISREDNFGIALYSKHPIVKNTINDLSGLDIPTVEAHIAVNNVDFTLISTHPLPPINKLYYESRNKQLEHITRRVNELNRATVVIGDLNITPWSAHYRVLETDTGLRSAGAYTPTWPTKILPMRIPIDHCLVSPHISIKSMRTGDNFGSDHLPLIVDLEI